MAFFDNIDAGKRALERERQRQATERLYKKILEVSAAIDAEILKDTRANYIVASSASAEALRQLYGKEEKKYNPGYRSGNQ